jgi:hypothetical protein
MVVYGLYTTKVDMNVDAEIYLKQLFGFFDGNPDALKSLIGELNKEKFYQRIRDAVYGKVGSEDEPVLSRKQMIDIIKELWDEEQEPLKEENFEFIDTFLKTDYGFFSLN